MGTEVTMPGKFRARVIDDGLNRSHDDQTSAALPGTYQQVGTRVPGSIAPRKMRPVIPVVIRSFKENLHALK